jgi:hypothetical protein
MYNTDRGMEEYKRNSKKLGVVFQNFVQGDPLLEEGQEDSQDAQDFQKKHTNYEETEAPLRETVLKFKRKGSAKSQTYSEKIQAEKAKRESHRNSHLKDKAVEQQELFCRFMERLEIQRNERLLTHQQKCEALEMRRITNEIKREQIQLQLQENKEAKEEFHERVKMALRSGVFGKDKENRMLAKERSKMIKEIALQEFEITKKERMVMKETNLLKTNPLMGYLKVAPLDELDGYNQRETVKQSDDRAKEIMMEKRELLAKEKEKKYLEQLEEEERSREKYEKLLRERKEREKMENQKKEKERADKEKQEMQEKEQDQLKRQKLEDERKERDKKRNEELERERAIKEKEMKEQLEKEKLEKEREHQKKIEKDLLEKDLKEQKERLEKERIEKLEKERIKLKEEELLIQEKRAQEQKEREKAQEEARVQKEKERIEAESIQKQKAMQEAKEKLEKEAEERQTKEKIEKEAEERKAKEKLEKEKKEAERLESLRKQELLKIEEEREKAELASKQLKLAEEEKAKEAKLVKISSPVVNDKIEDSDELNLNNSPVKNNDSSDFDFDSFDKSVDKKVLKVESGDMNNFLTALDSNSQQKIPSDDKMLLDLEKEIKPKTVDFSKPETPIVPSVKEDEKAQKVNPVVIESEIEEKKPKRGGIRGLRELANARNGDEDLAKPSIQTKTASSADIGQSYKIEGLFNADVREGYITNAMEEHFMTVEDLQQYYSTSEFNFDKFLNLFNDLIGEELAFFFDCDKTSLLVNDFKAGGRVT